MFSADLVALHDDPHPCGMIEILFAVAGSQRPWLNWVPMPTESIVNAANEIGRLRANGQDVRLTQMYGTAAEPASAVTASRRVTGPVRGEIGEFPRPDIRVPLRRGRFAIWRYDGTDPVPAVPAPSDAAVELVQTVAAEPWPSPLSGYLSAAPLAELPLDDLLGLLAHLPGPPDTPRWQDLAKSTPTPTRREVLMDLAFGVEDWATDSALFALVTAAFQQPEIREDARQVVRARLDAAVAANRLVTIEKSLAELMLITPGCRPPDRKVAQTALARDESPRKRRWWQRHAT